MAPYGKGSASEVMGDYKNLRTIPALLGILFTVASLYQFGGIAEVRILWGFDYALTTQAAMIASLLVLVIAFMSSETKSFEDYANWEQVMLAAGPLVMILREYWGWLGDQFAANAPFLPILGFAITIAAWGVAVR